MATFFLIIIYSAFISLGLPDSLLGVAWPVMQVEYGEPMETAGLLFMVIAGGTIISSLASGSFLKWWGTGKVTLISCIMTAGALLGFAVSPSLIWLIICAIPLGLGAGAVDTGLNNYVAIHYKAHHMSWLHCFWGVGATLGPVIMAPFITGQNSWRDGYLTIAGIQLALVLILFFTLPLWDRVAENRDIHLNGESENEVHDELVKQEKPLKIKGVKISLIAFLFYCGAEATIGLWGSSFLVSIKEVSIPVAAKWVSLYYAGITVGRLATGFITLKVNNTLIIRIGQITALIGAIILFLPFGTSFSLVGFILIGLGFAPIFPCMVHETPARFGKEHSQKIIGYQMAFAYTGSTFLPPFLGFIASHSTIGIFPFFIVIYIMVMLLGSERLNILMNARKFARKQKVV